MSVVTADRRFTGKGEDFGPRNGTLSVHLHTTEPTDPTKITLRDAIALHAYQDRDDTVGSYNRIAAIDGVLRCMDDDHASGGINPFSSYFSPRKWLYDFLPDYAVRDPNGWGPNFAAMGRKDYFDANGWPDTIIDGLARSIIEEEDRIERLTGTRPNLVIDNHADYQPGDRTDAGPICTKLVMARYNELVAAPPVPAIEVPKVTVIDFSASTHQIPKIVRIREGATLYKQPTGDEVHWVVPAGQAFDAELLLGNDNRFLARRRGVGSAFWIGMDAIDRNVPYILAEYGGSAAAVKAAVDAFNHNLEAWISQRPRS